MTSGTESPQQSGPSAATGLLLFTGGQGRRLGGPKQGLAHPAGGSWGGHLVAVFEAVCPGGPVLLLGDPLPDRPELIPIPDPRLGPAVALRSWAAQAAASPVRRWWLPACDQVHWTPAALRAWQARAEAADPEASNWVLARHDGHVQYLGGFLGSALLPRLRTLEGTSLTALAQALPTLELLDEAGPWQDVDTPEALRAWLG